MTDVHHIQVVVFDLDDTLFAERDYVRSGYQAVCEHLAGRGRIDARQGLDFLWSRFLSGQTGGALEALSEAFDLKLTPADIQELVRVYREHAPRIEPYDGVSELLGRLHADYRLGLLTDGYQPAQTLKLAALRLERFFDAAVFTEDLGRSAWKPSPKGFELIARRLGAPRAGCCYVGDNPAKDFLAPNQLGWRTIQYLHPGQVHAANAAPDGGSPQFVVKAPQELRNALRRPLG